MDVEELSENGNYSSDSVEVALVFNPEKEKVMFSLVCFFFFIYRTDVVM